MGDDGDGDGDRDAGEGDVKLEEGDGDDDGNNSVPELSFEDDEDDVMRPNIDERNDDTALGIANGRDGKIGDGAGDGVGDIGGVKRPPPGNNDGHVNAVTSHTIRTSFFN